MTRRRLIVGNWKMSGSNARLAELDAIEAAACAHRAVEVALCLPFTMIERAAARHPALMIGGQDCHFAADGAHTGDVSAVMLRESGAELVIVGHSERRAAYGETDALIRAKTEAALDAGLRVLICVGETESDFLAGNAEQTVIAQVEHVLPGRAMPGMIGIAYEPVWAIGSNRTPRSNEVASMHRAIRNVLADQSVPVLYGGAVTADNAGALLAVDEVDGLLVGGASLLASRFVPIIWAAAKAEAGFRAGEASPCFGGGSVWPGGIGQ